MSIKEHQLLLSVPRPSGEAVAAVPVIEGYYILGLLPHAHVHTKFDATGRLSYQMEGQLVPDLCHPKEEILLCLWLTCL